VRALKKKNEIVEETLDILLEKYFVKKLNLKFGEGKKKEKEKKTLDQEKKKKERKIKKENV